MDNFDLYKISAAKLAGKSCDTNCLFCISGAGRIRKKRNILWNIIQNVRKSTLICTAQGKCYNLSSCFFNTCFYKLQGKFSGTKDKTGSNSWPPKISLSSFVFAVAFFMSTFLLLFALYFSFNNCSAIQFSRQQFSAILPIPQPDIPAHLQTSEQEFLYPFLFFLSQQLPPPINCRISTTSPSFSTVVS